MESLPATHDADKRSLMDQSIQSSFDAINKIKAKDIKELG